MKMSDMEQIGKNDFSEQSLRKIIGEEYDIITKTPDGNTRNAQGYANLRNGIIAVLDGKMTTANHEATHVAIHNLKQINPKLADNAIGSIIRHYGAEELVNSANKAGYSDTVGHKLDFNNKADVRYAAEERLADDFAKYAEAKAKGRENYYAKKTGLPAQIKAWFDSVIDKLKDMAGRLDSAHNFMYKLERGDFAQMIDQQARVMRGEDSNAPATRPQMAYKIDPERALNTLKDFDDVLNGNKPKVEIARITPELSERIYKETGIKVGTNANYELTNGNAIHINNRHINNKSEVKPLTYTDIAEMPYVLENPDFIRLGKRVRGQEHIELIKQMSNNHKAVVEVIKKGDTLSIITYFNDTSSGRPNATKSPVDIRPKTGQLQSTYLDKNIPQDSDSVKMKLEQPAENNIKPETEAQDKEKIDPRPTRKFIESVIKTDPPAEFYQAVENMKGKGKYTPRNTKKLWAKAVEKAQIDPLGTLHNLSEAKIDKAIANGIALA